MQIFIVIALLFALFVAIFALSNSEIVNIRFFGNIYSMSQALIIIGCTVFGALAVMVLGLFSRIRTAFKMREYKNKIKNLEREIEKLKENINMLSNNKIENN
ncbi:LapA family protein [Thermovenabulum sp.]|uniref:LapA family protein n=1 Tax=Thermovenabulum sp. TaxID=3100335 RepID=UPI003C7CAE2D